MMPRCALRSREEFALWYTPGVAGPSLAIRDDEDLAYELTSKGNTVAVVTNGTRVLGLGPIGPVAGLPVMEGKALLFKYLGGVDAVPICLATTDPDELVRTVLLLQPAFGGINLEDIEQPTCFGVLDALRRTATVPVWHDDQQGTATAVLAGLLNAAEVVGKPLDEMRIAMVGMGAANVATFRLLVAAGVDPGAVVACDSRGTLHPGRHDLDAGRFAEKCHVAAVSNADGVVGGVAEAMRGADVCLAFSRPGPGTIEPDWVAGMAPGAVVFACANPVPEIHPDAARAAGARVVATGSGRFPNQVNNSLVFPGLFRGVLDVRAREISEAMMLAAAHELAAVAAEKGLQPDAIVPAMDDPELYPRVAVAAGTAAHEQGLARAWPGREALVGTVTARIAAARASVRALADAGCV